MKYAIFALMFSHNANEPGPRTKGQGAVGLNLGEPAPWLWALVPHPRQKIAYFTRKTTYSNRKFDIIDPNK